MDKKILIVDDNLEALEILKIILDKEGYVTYTASNGEECMKSVELFKPELVLLDVLLPDALGTDLCKDIKSDERYEDIIVILISGVKISPEDHALGLEIGASDYIKRPYNKRELIARVNSIFRLKETLVSKRKEEPFSSITRSSTSMTASIFEQESIDKAYPEKFNKFSTIYFEILSELIKHRIYKTSTNTSSKVKELASELGFLKASSRDVINIHKEALKKLVHKSSAIKTYYIKEESRILLVELMGYLLSYYRNLS